MSPPSIECWFGSLWLSACSFLPSRSGSHSDCGPRTRLPSFCLQPFPPWGRFSSRASSGESQGEEPINDASYNSSSHLAESHTRQLLGSHRTPKQNPSHVPWKCLKHPTS